MMYLWPKTIIVFKEAKVNVNMRLDVNLFKTLFSDSIVTEYLNKCK